ncbi:TIGR02444 family protein [Pseudomonas sp. GD03860]|uniref:TIGR02444 family protein n=1 Tax=Pseudomonas TaxID=286 RepID=UPI002363DC6C|nr:MULTISPECIES: TIGR02444 family protein [Pseudomonas]MDD2059484.1 TIGR02444 family protein [Pseudomonas putida]MDH0637637.1 TIGR02444 family protein [Pseudomonas sp. GD03860]
MHTDLWNFALNLYARPGVEAACLQWQDQGGDVCLLLCAAWLHERGVTPNEQQARELCELANAWQVDVVTPLRKLRQQWRAASGQDEELAHLRKQVKGLELAAERVLLERLEAISEAWEKSGPLDSLWMQWAVPSGSSVHHDALQKLRAVMLTTQDAEDGV